MKNRNVKILVFGVLSVLVVYYYRIFNAAQKLKYSAGSLTNFNWSNGQISWVQGINIQNFDFVSIPIRSVGVVNYIGNAEIGTTVLDSPFTVQGSGQSELKVRVSIPTSNLVALGSAVLTAIRSGRIEMRFKGELNSVGFSFPIDQKYILNIPKLKI